MCSILLLPLVARCLRHNRCMYMAHVCCYDCCSDCVGVCGNVSCVATVVKDSVFLGMGSNSVSSCRCCVFVCILWQFSMLNYA